MHPSMFNHLPELSDSIRPLAVGCGFLALGWVLAVVFFILWLVK